MKTEKEIEEELEKLKRINAKAPYDKKMFYCLTIQINTLNWVLEK